MSGRISGWVYRLVLLGALLGFDITGGPGVLAAPPAQGPSVGPPGAPGAGTAVPPPMAPTAGPSSSLPGGSSGSVSPSPGVPSGGMVTLPPGFPPSSPAVEPYPGIVGSRSNCVVGATSAAGSPSPPASLCPPANLRVLASGPSPGSYTVGWDPPMNETVTEYRIVSIGAGGDTTPLFRAAGSVSQALLAGLDPAIGYSLAVVAVDTRGRESLPSNHATIVGAPTATPVLPPTRVLPYSGSPPPYGVGPGGPPGYSSPGFGGPPGAPVYGPSPGGVYDPTALQALPPPSWPVLPLPAPTSATQTPLLSAPTSNWGGPATPTAYTATLGAWVVTATPSPLTPTPWIVTATPSAGTATSTPTPGVTSTPTPTGTSTLAPMTATATPWVVTATATPGSSRPTTTSTVTPTPLSTPTAGSQSR